MDEITKDSNTTCLITNSGAILECPSQLRSRTLNPYTYAPIPCWQPQPPFWYKTKCENEKYYGDLQTNINQYGFSKLAQPEKFLTIFDELQIERPERYLPGEIYKGKTPKDAVTMGNMSCSNVWKPKSDTFHTDFDTRTLKPRPLLECDILEQAEKSREMFIKQLSNEIAGCV